MKPWLRYSSMVMLAVPAAAQDSPYGTSDYGGGWAVPSLDTSLAIGREAANQAVIGEILRKERQQAGGDAPADKPGLAAPPGRSLFAAALTGGKPPAGGARTGFVRDKARQDRTEAALLAQIRQRNPSGAPEFERFFAKQDMAAIFARATAGYGLGSDDAADTMAAYWLSAWQVASGADDFTPAQARGVRAQVAAALARGRPLPVVRLQQMADEAIFNTLLLSGIQESMTKGSIARRDYDRVGAATNAAFRPLGIDLTRLTLGDTGFRARP